MISVAVVGAGYWGPNLIRNFAACAGSRLTAVCDSDPRRLAEVRARYPAVETTDRLETILSRPDIDAIALATPVATHGPLALAALEAGKHVLVEKPLALSTEEALAVAAAADQRGLVLLVDHTYVYAPAVRKIKAILSEGRIGQLYFVDGVRINLGLFRHDVNVVWDLASHDVSILDFLLERLPRGVSAFGASHIDPARRVEDSAHLNLDYGDGLLASFHVNWLSPVKVRHLLIGGSEGSILYNDLEPTEKLKIYDRGVRISDAPESRRGMLVDYRTGDVWSPHLESTEALDRLVHHFIDCIRTGGRPLSGGAEGVRVVKVLEAAQQSIQRDGIRQTLEATAAHRTAIASRSGYEENN